MIAILLALSAAAQPLDSTAVLELCKSTLARKAGGEISEISTSSVRAAPGGLILHGQMTVFLGDRTAAPGTASPHHLIRATFDFKCRSRGHRIRETSVSQH